MTAPTSSESDSFTYDEFASWYSTAEKRFLDPARITAVRLLSELLDSKVSGLDRQRFRISASRVKSAQRTFAKLSGEKYRHRVTQVEEVPSVIDDLVGVRLVCNNLSDVGAFQELIGELPIDNSEVHELSIEDGSQRDYFSEPKASGYRAFHVNLVVPVAQAKGTKRLRVEVQVRTLLQDGWGELTHEDSYKPGSQVPEWIVGMSLRMAELLAAVDNIAQDLREGLDIETQRQVESEIAVAIPPHAEADIIIDAQNDKLDIGTPEVERSQLYSALLAEVRTVVSDIDRPTPLAVLSQSLIKTFGSEITEVWASLGGFKRLLEEAQPDVLVTGPSPGYVHPLNEKPSPEWEQTWDGALSDVPEFVLALPPYERRTPVVSGIRIAQLATAVAEALNDKKLSTLENGRVSRSQITGLSLRARELAANKGQLVTRGHALFVLNSLANTDLLVAGITSEQILIVLRVSILRLADRAGLIRNRDDAANELSTWLGLLPRP